MLKSKGTVSQNESEFTSMSSRIEPWNHKQFLKRVSTFNSLKWHIKRTDVTPLLCARYGWECIHKNTLKCNGCKTQINYKTNPLWSKNINNKIANTFKQNIQLAHTSECQWKLNPCNILFEYLPINKSIMKQEIINNLYSWTTTDNNSFYLIPNIQSTIKNQIINTYLTNNSIFNSTNKTNESVINLILLSACGWYLNNNTFIQCKWCNKCISIHSYDYKKILLLFPKQNPLANQMENDSENECDISTILSKELPINDTKSVINRLSKLGLKMSKNIKRIYSFQLYETPILQKQISFTNTNSKFKQKSFGWNINKRNSNSMSISPMCWPKQSILTQSNLKVKNRKRMRDQMSIDNEIECKNMSSDCPRKKMRFNSRSNSTSRSNSIEIPMVSQTSQTQRPRKNRKRKTMESTNENCSSELHNLPLIKKRRIGSLSTHSSTFSTPINNKRISRKRKYNDIFSNSNTNNSNRNVKRVRLDTPCVNQKLYFEIINLHNNYCPFKKKYKYNTQNNNNNKEIFGWEYCLQLLPNDIIYIQQIAEESKKGNKGKQRF